MGKLIDFVKRGKKDTKPDVDPLLAQLADEIERSASRKARDYIGTRLGRSLAVCFIIALIGTMLPIKAANLFFSVATIVILALPLLLKPRPVLSRRIWAVAAMPIAVSTATDCSPFLKSTNAHTLNFCEDNTGNACKYGTSIGYSVLGIPVQTGTIAQAKITGGIDKVFGVETDRGFGLVSVTRGTVYGG